MRLHRLGLFPLVLLAILVSSLLACSDSGSSLDPPSLERVHEVCEVWADVGCRKNIECGVEDRTLEACMADERQRCIAGVNGEESTCRSTRADRLEECAGGLEDETCSEYCSTSENGFTFCYYPCIYYCPAAP